MLRTQHRLRTLDYTYYQVPIGFYARQDGKMFAVLIEFDLCFLGEYSVFQWPSGYPSDVYPMGPTDHRLLELAETPIATTTAQNTRSGGMNLTCNTWTS